MARLNVPGGLGDYLREQRRTAQDSVRQLAALAGASNPYLTQVERGLRKPSAELLQQVAKGLRVSADALTAQAGLLEDRHVDREVPQAVLGDSTLTERQKKVLLDIYESFCRENETAAEWAAPEDAEPAPAPPEPDSAEPDRP